MAEVFGAVSAGIGVAAAAGQLIDGIMKLHSFCARVRNIPDEVRSAIDDLAAMTELLAFLQAEMGHESLPLQSSSSSGSLKVLSSLWQSSQEVRQILEEMRQMVEKKHSWGRVKAVGMTKKLEKAAKRAENAQRMVVILLAAENRMTLRQNLNALGSNLTAISNRLISMSNSDNVVNSRIVNAQAIDNTAEMITNSADSVVRHSTKNDRTRGRVVKKIRMSLPNWLSEQVWEFKVYKANQGWDFRLRSYNTRPYGAEIFNVVVRGDLARVRELLNSNKANMCDRDPKGRGVLHYAAMVCALNGHETIEYLVKSGADIHDTDSQGYPPYQFLWRYALRGGSIDLRGYGDEQTNLRLAAGYRTFMSNKGWDPSCPSYGITLEEDKFGADFTDKFPLFNGPPKEIVKSFINEMWPPWEHWSPSDRLEALLPWTRFHGSLGRTDTECMRVCLDHEFIQSTYTTWKKGHRIRLLYFIFEALAEDLKEGSAKRAEESRSFLQDMHLSGGLISILRDEDALFWFVYIYIWQCFKGLGDVWYLIRSPLLTIRIQEGLKYFLSEMLLLNIPMDILIEIEKSFSYERRNEQSWPKVFTYLGSPVRILKIDYGPSIEDWYLWWSNPIDEFAGEFWDMVEHPERTIPGSWVEETN